MAEVLTPQRMKIIAGIVIVMAGVFPSCACSARLQPVLGPVGPAAPEELIRDYVSRGDEAFRAMHLHGWRLAEAAYATAYSLAPRPEIRDKLLLSRLLRMTREIDEDIPCPSMAEDIRFICAQAVDARGQAMCDLAQGYAAGPPAAAEPLKRLDPAVLQTDTSPLDAYVYTLLARTYGVETDDYIKKLEAKYRDTPLFRYLNLGTGAAPEARIIEQIPDFAEAWEFSAEVNFQRTRITTARGAFNRALDLIPDYTRAINGLANIYFFTLEDYENALRMYDRSLALDPENTAAIFGRGAILHHLGRYEESNAALDRMLAGDLSRRGRVTPDSVRYYRGQAYYYKAYNHHLMKNPQQARLLIDAAKQSLSQAEEINYLSGLLYFNDGMFEAAKADFTAAVKTGKHCHSYYYLGLIEHRVGKSTAGAQFVTSGACMERRLGQLQNYIRTIPGLELEPEEKIVLQAKMERKLLDSRDFSAGLIASMSGLIRESAIEVRFRQSYLDILQEMLVKIRAISLQRSSESTR